MEKTCPRCNGIHIIKSGVIQNRQRFKCKACKYHFTVEKQGKRIDDYYVTKALQLYVEGVSFREIERLLGISHVTVMNWVRNYGIKRPTKPDYHPTYRIMTHEEVKQMLADKGALKGMGMVVTELGDKFMVIRWERFRSR